MRLYYHPAAEPDGLGFDDLQRLEGQLQRAGLNVAFAYDTLRVAV